MWQHRGSRIRSTTPRCSNPAGRPKRGRQQRLSLDVLHRRPTSSWGWSSSRPSRSSMPSGWLPRAAPLARLGGMDAATAPAWPLAAWVAYAACPAACRGQQRPAAVHNLHPRQPATAARCRQDQAPLCSRPVEALARAGSQGARPGHHRRLARTSPQPPRRHQHAGAAHLQVLGQAGGGHPAALVRWDQPWRQALASPAVAAPCHGQRQRRQRQAGVPLCVGGSALQLPWGRLLQQ